MAHPIHENDPNACPTCSGRGHVRSERLAAGASVFETIPCPECVGDAILFAVLPPGGRELLRAAFAPQRSC